MRASSLLAATAVVLASTAGPAAAAPPPHLKEVTAWAKAADYKLATWTACTGHEERALGALGAICWAAKRRTPDKGTRMYPRLVVRLQTFADEAKAEARMARFRRSLAGARGPGDKAYPLRAGFRLGERVVVVTTDAYAFEGDVYRAAAELAAALGGTELTCWKTCP